MMIWSEAARFGLMCAGLLFTVGVLCGVWKYVCIRRSTDAVAPEYVNIAHRAALMYAFSTALLAMLAQQNAWSTRFSQGCIGAAVAMFAVSIASYVLHGALRDTDNQFRPPFKLGPRPVHGGWVDGFMALKASIEIGATLLLLLGFARAA